MKIFFLFFLLLVFENCFSQSLRDSLYGGKLKIDSAILKKANIASQKSEKDSLKKAESDSVVKSEADTLAKKDAQVKPTLEFKDNPKTWKKFIDQFTATLNTEVLSSKKIKRGSYTVLVDYEIGVDGTISTKNISCSPSNDYLAEQVNERFASSAPQLAPLIRDGVHANLQKGRYWF